MNARFSTVLGARGLVGSHLAYTLQQQGEETWCPDRSEQDQLFKRPLGTVYYCAGLTADFAQRPYDAVEAHVSLLSSILKYAEFERLVYLSSTRLYDSLGAINATEDVTLNFSVADPRHLYDLSKALGENLCLRYSEGRGKVARLSCVLGKSLDDGFLPGLLKQCLGNEGVKVNSSPHFVRDYIGLDDVVALLINVGQRGTQDIYNVASGLNIENSQVFSVIEQITGCQLQTTSVATCAAPLINIQRIKEEFGFSPVGIQQLLEELAASRGSTRF